jgi:predicted MPP superfamily phosphohydrolase
MRSFFESRALKYDLVASAVDDNTSPRDNSVEGRLGSAHARRRRMLSERQQEARLARRGFTLFDLEEMATSQFLIRAALTASGLYRRGVRNAARVEIRRNHITSHRLPGSFSGFTILHLSDLHTDMSQNAMRQVVSLVQELHYDICVFTGDFRGETFGPFDEGLTLLKQITSGLKGPLFGVLGNHDPIAIAPGLEALGIRILLNECVVIERGVERIYLAGIDDAHFYRSDSIDRAASQIPREEFSMLISHTPEVYQEAERSGFDVMLSGHTHGGQICLPGGIPITLDAKVPRRMRRGAWRYGRLQGYTSVGAGVSVVPVRFNCPPEITLHHFKYLA